MRARRLRGLLALLSAVALSALGAAALQPAAAEEEPGPPGRPILVEPGPAPAPEGVVVEGVLREREGSGSEPGLVLVGTGGRVYAITNGGLARLLERRLGERVVVEGRVKATQEGPDVLVVETVRFGER